MYSFVLLILVFYIRWGILIIILLYLLLALYSKVL